MIDPSARVVQPLFAGRRGTAASDDRRSSARWSQATSRRAASSRERVVVRAVRFQTHRDGKDTASRRARLCPAPPATRGGTGRRRRPPPPRRLPNRTTRGALQRGRHAPLAERVQGLERRAHDSESRRSTAPRTRTGAPASTGRRGGPVFRFVSSQAGFFRGTAAQVRRRRGRRLPPGQAGRWERRRTRPPRGRARATSSRGSVSAAAAATRGPRTRGERPAEGVFGVPSRPHQRPLETRRAPGRSRTARGRGGVHESATAWRRSAPVASACIRRARRRTAPGAAPRRVPRERSAPSSTASSSRSAASARAAARSASQPRGSRAPAGLSTSASERASSAEAAARSRPRLQAHSTRTRPARRARGGSRAVH